MPRRAAEHESGFGTEAFLDVLSNIVGIMIILIVMVGMHLSRVPPTSAAATSVPLADPVLVDPVLDELPPELPTSEEPAEYPGEAIATNFPNYEPPPLPNPEEPTQEVREQLEVLRQFRAALAVEAQQEEVLLAELAARREDAQTELQTLSQGAANQQQKLQERKARLHRLRRELGEKRDRLTGILAEFEETTRSQPATQTIRHRLTPVSQEITGQELHFRVSGGRVTAVPITELIERVKQQVERRRELAAARGGYKGVVGPIDGYSLEFIIEARRMSPHEERQMGMREGYTLELSRCVIIPDPNLQGETVEEALRRGSQFAMALRTADSGASLTFWTYPDSFADFRKLQSACHAEGFLVAGRPMPFGQNIIGDRRLGTRSAGQ